MPLAVMPLEQMAKATAVGGAGAPLKYGCKCGASQAMLRHCNKTDPSKNGLLTFRCHCSHCRAA